MLINITPSGNELQRKMLLNHSSKMRNSFIALLLLIPLAVLVGDYYSARGITGQNEDNLKNIAMIQVQGDGSISQGTAFLVCNNDGTSSGYLFTARHVVDGTVSSQVVLTFPYIKDDANDEPLTTSASIVWTTNVPFDGADMQTLRYDVCLLKLDDLSVLPNDVIGFMIGSEMNIKDPIAIYGFPGGTEYANTGEISSTNYNGAEDLMLLSFQIDHGLSGAPVYSDEAGEVLGIAIASETDSDIKNIALKMSRVLELMDRDGVAKLLN